MRHENRIFKWAALGVAAAIAAGVWTGRGDNAAFAQGSTAAGPTRVAVLDVPEVLERLDEKGEREAEFQLDIAMWQAQLDDATASLRALEGELEVLPEDDPQFQAKQNEMIVLEVRRRTLNELATRRVEDRRVQLQAELFTKIIDAARRYAQREGLDIVITSDRDAMIPANAPPGQVQAAIASRRVVFASETIDLTSAVAQFMNNEFKNRRP